jgi:hypothetical protein
MRNSILLLALVAACGGTPNALIGTWENTTTNDASTATSSITFKTADAFTQSDTIAHKAEDTILPKCTEVRTVTGTWKTTQTSNKDAIEFTTKTARRTVSGCEVAEDNADEEETVPAGPGTIYVYILSGNTLTISLPSFEGDGIVYTRK